MDVKLILEPMEPALTALTGGGYAEVTAEIHVDSNLPLEDQRETAIHEAIEGYCPMWPHEAKDELTGIICETLEKLEEAWKASTLSKTQTPDLPGDVKRFADVTNP